MDGHNDAGILVMTKKKMMVIVDVNSSSNGAGLTQ